MSSTRIRYSAKASTSRSTESLVRATCALNYAYLRIGGYMAISKTAPLDAGARLPNLVWRFLDGTTRTLPTDRYTVIVIYRGQW
jgi:hypothetical protein